MKNGKVYQFFKNNWRIVLYCASFFAGIFCGLWSCSKHTAVTIDAYRPRINVEQPKMK